MNDLIYDALMLGRNKSVSREEYLVYKKDKSPVSFKVQENEITFQNVMNDTSGIVHIELCSEGFAEIEVYTQDAFIELPGKVFTTDEFRSGVYEFTFTVRAGKLHAGRNYAMISFRTPVCTSCTKVVVYNQIVPVASDSTRKTIGLLCRDYLDLRLGNLFQTEWQNRALKILDNISGSDRNDLFLSLYKANVLISCERYEEAKSLIDFVSGQITRLPRTEWEIGRAHV